MAQAIRTATSIPASAARADFANPSYRAYQILHLGFVVAPIVAGLDMFFHVLVDWAQPRLRPLDERLAMSCGL